MSAALHGWHASAADGSGRVAVDGTRAALDLGRSTLDEVELPAALDEVIDNAVDPYEIAAMLEASGFSNGVMRDSFGERDIFAAAERLFGDGMKIGRVGPAAVVSLRTGRFGDLARGAMFAIPSVVVVASTDSMRLRLAWWSLPLGLLVGWPCSQAVAVVLSSMIGAKRAAGVAVIVSLLASAALSGGVAAAVVTELHGSALSGGVSAGLAFYVACCAVLLAFEEAWLMAVALAPAGLVAALYLTHVLSASGGDLVGGLACAAGVTTFALALRHGRDGGWKAPGLLASTWARAGAYFLYGLCCGATVSTLVAVSTYHVRVDSWSILVPYPLMATLGVMEWQVRTFTASVREVLATTRSHRRFESVARFTFERALASYLGALVLATAGAAALISTRHHGVPTSMLASVVLLGGCLFVGLIIGCLNRVDLVLKAWAGGSLAFLAFLGAEHLAFGSVSGETARLAYGGGLLSIFVFLVVGAHRLVARPFSY